MTANPHCTFQNLVVVGAGTMGHGIAQVSAMAGLRVTLVDVAAASVEAGLAKIRDNLEAGVRKGKVSEELRDGALGRLRGATGLEVGSGREALREADLLIEAIPERMELKQSLFREADALLPPHAVLASNTSSLSITEMASATGRPGQVIGLHFFNPVHIMKLLEIVRGAGTSEGTLAQAQAYAAALGKTSIVVQDAPGFATSRLGITLGNEAMRMVEEGVASPLDIDTAMKLGYGHPMGPLALSDLVGLDVRMHITSALHQEIGTEGFRPPRILRKLVRAGHLGKKTGSGFYVWEEGQPLRPNPLVWSSATHA